MPVVVHTPVQLDDHYKSKGLKHLSFREAKDHCNVRPHGLPMSCLDIHLALDNPLTTLQSASTVRRFRPGSLHGRAEGRAEIKRFIFSQNLERQILLCGLSRCLRGVEGGEEIHHLSNP